MFTMSRTTQDGKLRTFLGLTAAELSGIHEIRSVLSIHTRPELWWAIVIEGPQGPGAEEATARARKFMKKHYGVTKPNIATMSAEDVTDLLKCEQRVFYCSSEKDTDLIVFVEKSENTLRASLPLFGIDSSDMDGNRASVQFSVN
jgi:hypothetical protein